jgi:uncharacterized protein
VLTRGGFFDVVAYRAKHIVERRFAMRRYLWKPGGPGGLLGGPLPLFLLGLVVGRRRVFQNMWKHAPFIRSALPWSLGLGLVCTVISMTGKWPAPILPYDERHLRGVLWYFGTPALSFSYAGLIILLAQKVEWQKRFVPLAALGRTALSNYLLQSLIFSTIFHHYGLGLAGKVGPGLNIVLTLLIYGLQLPLSVWWLRHFRFGPVEWLWRSLTYGSIQSMRLKYPTSYL